MALRPGPVITPRSRKPAAWSAWTPVLRARDLVALWASWRGLTLERDPRGGARLVAESMGGLLRFRFDYQHLAEQAFSMPPPDTFGGPVPPAVVVPVRARAAGRSRLVFTVPAEAAVGYSVEGLLEAMGRLTPAVAPAAAPAGVDFALYFGALAAEGGAMAPAVRMLAESGGGRVTRVDPSVARGPERARAMAAANRMRRGGLLGGVVEPDRDQAVGPPVVGPGPRPIWKLPAIREPRAEETAIEAPFRLLISPSAKGGWAHATAPVPAAKADRIELWHTRLGVRAGDRVDERSAGERIVRAIWTRDRDGQAELPFLNSLTALDRERIVRQTAGTELAPRIRPRAANVRRLALSSVGAWVDLEVRWNWRRYVAPFGDTPPLASWEHVAPMGRDQWVEVVTPGYLFPLGHAASLVKITYRKIVGATKPQAALFQKKFILVDEPQKSFARRDLPFVSARLAPGRTPDLNDASEVDAFWPTPLGASDPFEWRIEALDHDGRPVHLQAPLVFVPVKGSLDTDPVERRKVQDLYAARYDKVAKGVPANGQLVAFAPALAGDEGKADADATAEVDRLLLGGEPRSTTSRPFLHTARVVVPAIQRLTGAGGGDEVAYPKVYRDHGFGAANAGNVYLELARYQNLDDPPFASPTELSFGTSERSGGFIRPDVAVAGLARSTGLVADVAEAAAGRFKAADLFGAGLPKLFGIFDLVDLIPDGALDLAPKFVTEALDRVTGLLADLAAIRAAIDEFSVAGTGFAAKVEEVEDAVVELVTGDAAAIGAGRVTAALDAVSTELDAVAAAVAAAPFEPMALATFDRLLGAVRGALRSDAVAAVLAFAEGLLPGGGEFRAKLDWRPKVRDFPASGPPILHFEDPDNALVVSVEARTAGGRPTGLEVAAQLSGFQLNLLPGFELMEVHFERIAFRASGARRPEIDIVFKELKFVGVLSFVQVLKELIPLDGFSDPPFLDVSAEGISAGFTVALPNLAIGVFSLTNISLGADARVPFLGEAVSVGFNFCTRERPFTLAVAFLGGGGFLGLRLNPDGLVLLEGAFEFGAVVALDFGVASGSVSVMAGIYFKIEGEQGQLTGYLRIRGEVDVLGLISASLELYLALTYHTAPQDKLIGEASMTIKVEVLFFSTSVSVKARRVFAGSNGDPTVRQMLLVDERGDAVWNEYWAAFAPAKAEG